MSVSWPHRADGKLGNQAQKILSRSGPVRSMIPAEQKRPGQAGACARHFGWRSFYIQPDAQMPLIIPQESGRSATVDRPVTAYLSSAYSDGWRVLGWLGLAFFVMSLIDIALGWYPMRFGTPEWEFGTISATVAALSIPTLGLYLMLASAISRERAGIAKAVGVAMILLAVALPVLGILYLTNVPLALKATATNDVVHFGMKKAVLKSVTLFAGYELLYVLGAMKALRRQTAF